MAEETTTEHVLIIGKRFIDALKEAGLLPRGCLRVEIVAVIDEPVRMTYEVIGDSRLDGLAAGIEPTEDPEAARVR